MLRLTKELRALKGSNGIADLSLSTDLFIHGEDIAVLETSTFPWGKATHILVAVGGHAVDFVVKENPDEIIDMVKSDSYLP